MHRVKNISIGHQSLPFVLSIAGMDPSGGAGLLADIKTFQSQDTYGLGIISCNTIQTDEQLYHVDWQSEKVIIAGIEKICARFPVAVIKLGAMRHAKMLENIIDEIYRNLPEASIVWDPVIKPTNGPHFFELLAEDLSGKRVADWKRMLQKCTLITPNGPEAVLLCQLLGLGDKISSTKPAIKSIDQALWQMAGYTSVLLKGGHLNEMPVVDRLYERSGDGASGRNINNNSNGGRVRSEAIVFGPQTSPQPPSVMSTSCEKHGSGCVHSSLVAAMLAKGFTLKQAAAGAKDYMDQFLFSCPGRLGVHGWPKDAP